MALFINNGSLYPQGDVVTSTTANPIYVEGGVVISVDTNVGQGVALSVDLGGGLTPIVQNEGTLKALGGKLFGQTAGAGIALVGHNSTISSQLVGGYVGNVAGTIAGYDGVRITGGIGDVQNGGVIIGYYGAGMYANAGGALANNQGATVASQGTAAAVDIIGGPATVNSLGTISAASGFGVYLNAGSSAIGGSLANGGVITGGTGAMLAGKYGTVIGYGTITGTTGDGVDVLGIGTITNLAGGTIAALTGGEGLFLKGGGVVSNAAKGTISAATDHAVSAAAYVSISNGGVLTAGGTHSVISAVAGGNVFNSAGGSIAALHGGGVYLSATTSADERVFNAASGVISGYIGVYLSGGSETVTNLGTLTGVAKSGVNLLNGGVLNNEQGGTITGALRSVYIGQAAGTVENAGLITAATGNGVALGAGGTVTNVAGGMIASSSVAVQASVAATVLNAGTLYGGSYGVYLGKGGAVTNQASGTIQGSGVVTGSKSAQAYGIRISGAAGTISNIGTVYGRNAAILMTGGGALANQVGGLIKNQVGSSVSITVPVASASDVLLTGTVAATIANAGTIGAIGTIALADSINPDLSGAIAASGISAVGGLYFNNLATGTIAGGYGVRDIGGPVSISNAGTIHGNASAAATATVTVMTQAAVDFGGTGGGIAYLSNASSGVIYGYAGIRSAVVATVVNAGSITGHLCIDLRGGEVTNRVGGMIASNGNKLAGENAPASIQFAGYGTVLNAGTIGSSTTITEAIGFNGAAAGADYLSNASAGLVFGLVELFRPGTVMNAGQLVGGEAGGVVFSGGDTLVNVAHAHIDGGIGTSLAATGSANTVVNAGTIDGVGVSMVGPTTVINQAGGTILVNSGLPGAGAPVSLTGGSETVTNAGTIATGGGVAVYLGPGFANRLIVDPGAVFVGTIEGGNPAGGVTVSTLEFGAGTGTLGGLGTSIFNFGSIVFDAGADWTVAGRIFATSVLNDGTMTATGAVAETAAGFDNSDQVIVNGGSLGVTSGAFQNDGTVTVENGGTFFVANAAALTGSGSVLMTSGAVTEIAVPVAVGQGFTYSDPTTLILDDPAGFDGTVGGLGAGDVIALGGEAITAGHISDTVLTLDLAGGGTQTLNVAPGESGLSFVASPGGLTVACFAAGTRILTNAGEVEVEMLAVGKVVVTLAGRLRPVRWIGQRTINVIRHPTPVDVNPVRIGANAFGPGVPHRDLMLSPDHAVVWRDGLIPVRHLCNGATVQQEAVEQIKYFHVELDAHDVLLAEGLPAESYLDTGNRAAFGNGCTAEMELAGEYFAAA